MSLKTTVDDVATGVGRIRCLFANAYFVGESDHWTLVDAGIPGYADAIEQAAADRFGTNRPPVAIILTHGHFDHVGSLKDLLARWDVPVYAHAMELPHLTGTRDYPKPDPGVGKGAMALLSFTYPEGAIDISGHVRALPDTGDIPFLPGWRVVHTPGHTAGHISLYRYEDKVLIAGDAFVTVQQESLYAVARQKEEVHGPPAYFTPDWESARDSVRTLAGFEPEIGATGHGTPMRGEALRRGLHHLVEHFDEIAVPDRGRYVEHGESSLEGEPHPPGL